MTRNAAEEIDSLSRLKRRGRAAQILNDRIVLIRVIDLIPLENHTTLVLSQVFGKLRILLDAYAKKVPKCTVYSPRLASTRTSPHSRG